MLFLFLIFCDDSLYNLISVNVDKRPIASNKTNSYKKKNTLKPQETKGLIL